jgi:hypothetical protein
MVIRFYPTKDATIYEANPNKNTGLDAILELNKTITATGAYNSRVLLGFDYTTISSSIAALGVNPKSCSYGLKMYTATADEIPTDYTIYAYPIGNSWDMGVGRSSNIPITTTGVSWLYRESEDIPSTAWPTSSFPAGTTGSWNTSVGGGIWYTSSAASQSYSYTTTDIDMDVSGIIRSVQSGSFPFYGFLIKKSETDEASSKLFGSLKFFSKDTNTVYLPVLEVKYDDSVNAQSLTPINVNEENRIILTNLKKSYPENSRPIFRISARPLYPPYTFSTVDPHMVEYRLPTGSQYAVYSAQSEDVVIDFSNYTKVSDDAAGNYIKLHLDSFQPERYYKLLFRVPNGDGTYEVYDNKWIFKVARS